MLLGNLACFPYGSAVFTGCGNQALISILSSQLSPEHSNLCSYSLDVSTRGIPKFSSAKLILILFLIVTSSCTSILVDACTVSLMSLALKSGGLSCFFCYINYMLLNFTFYKLLLISLCLNMFLTPLSSLVFNTYIHLSLCILVCISICMSSLVCATCVQKLEEARNRHQLPSTWNYW